MRSNESDRRDPPAEPSLANEPDETGEQQMHRRCDGSGTRWRTGRRHGRPVRATLIDERSVGDSRSGPCFKISAARGTALSLGSMRKESSREYHGRSTEWTVAQDPSRSEPHPSRERLFGYPAGSGRARWVCLRPPHHTRRSFPEWSREGFRVRDPLRLDAPPPAMENYVDFGTSRGPRGILASGRTEVPTKPVARGRGAAFGASGWSSRRRTSTVEGEASRPQSDRIRLHAVHRWLHQLYTTGGRSSLLMRRRRPPQSVRTSPSRPD